MKRIKSLLRQPFYIAAQVFFITRATWFVWYYIVNRTARALYRSNPVKLSALQERITADLQRDGIAYTHLDELFPGKAVLKELQDYIAPLLSSATAKTDKTFFKQMWPVVPELDFSNPFVRRILDITVVQITNAYMQMYSTFYYLALNVTAPVGDAAPVASQRWHRDPEDKRMLKMFIYLNDVDLEAGPFMFLKGSQYGGRYGDVFPQKPPQGVYPDATELEKLIDTKDIHVCTGKAGAVIFADTSGLHKGGYAKTKQRIMFTGGFYSVGCVWPLLFTKSKSFDADLKKFTSDPSITYALTAPRPRFGPWLFRKFGRKAAHM
jgi:hypothetical protein